jgi:CHAD domain-containing protein
VTYRLRGEHSVESNVRKVARDQIEKSIKEITSTDMDRHEIVHQVRKRCKKIRGLIRLVRPAFEDYQYENRFFRDAARELSYVRDAQSMIECLDDLMERYRAELDPSAFSRVRDELLQRRREIADDRVGLDKKLQDFLAKMRLAVDRAERWRIRRAGFAAVSGGLKKTYARGCKAVRAAYSQPSAESFHELRKRVKYHWCHARLLREIWPQMMKAERSASDELSDLLGDHHDLAVLRQMLLDRCGVSEDSGDLRMLVGLIDQRQRELQAKAKPLSHRLFAEEPKQRVKRFHGYWKTWQAISG